MPHMYFKVTDLPRRSSLPHQSRQDLRRHGRDDSLSPSPPRRPRRDSRLPTWPPRDEEHDARESIGPTARSSRRRIRTFRLRQE
jgi:hypothetical protein